MVYFRNIGVNTLHKGDDDDDDDDDDNGYFPLSMQWRKTRNWRYRSTHLLTLAQNGSSQRHAPAAFPPREGALRCRLNKRLTGWVFAPVWTLWWWEKCFALTRNQTDFSPGVQSSVWSLHWLLYPDSPIIIIIILLLLLLLILQYNVKHSAHLRRFRVRIPREHECLPFFECCQVEVFATGRSLV